MIIIIKNNGNEEKGELRMVETSHGPNSNWKVVRKGDKFTIWMRTHRLNK